jgi:uncharacterized protein (DUF362 family)
LLFFLKEITLMHPFASIASGSDPYHRTAECLRALGTSDYSGTQTAFIKFNTAPYHLIHSTGAAGHPETVRAVIHYLREYGVRQIRAGDGPSAADPAKGFLDCGFTRVCQEEGVELVDLDRAETVEVTIPGAQSLYTVPMTRVVLESDLLVDVAWMRTHGYTTISLCMKNLMGVIGQPRDVMHEPFPQKITDLQSFLRPGLCVIDGTTALDEGMSRVPVPMNLTIAGRDAVSVDAVGTAIMGFDPLEIEHIWLAQERGLGIATLERIGLTGCSIGEVKRSFARLGQGFREVNGAG